MKKSIILLLSVVFMFLGCENRAFAERTYIAPTKGAVYPRDSSATNIPTTYTTGAGIASSVSGKSHVKVINKSSTDIAIAFSTATDCVGASDSDIALAGGTSVSDNMGTNSIICARSLGSTISSGMIYIIVW